MRRCIAPITVLFIAAIMSCGGDAAVDPPTPPPPPPPPPPVASVTVSPASASVDPGESVSLSATARDAVGNTLSDRTITWSSSATEVASVSGSGVVTGNTPGSATVTATSEGQTGQANITVIAPPAPVATVVVSPPSVALELNDTTSLTVALLDAAGNLLTGRSVAFSSSNDEVASVNASGLVTGVAPGAATITATSEGRIGEAVITVTAPVEGAEIGPEGGTVEMDGGTVRIDVPAGAVSEPTFFGVEVSTRTHADPEGSWLVGGPAYTLYPEGASFGVPVTVTIEYDEALIPAWVDPATLGLLRWDGAAWHRMDDVVVDVENGTISGTTSSFSDLSLEVELPTITISPGTGHVSEIQRSVTLVAEPDHVSTLYWHNFSYEWTSTEQSGHIVETEGNSARYLMTSTAVAPNQVADDVTVTVMAQRFSEWDDDPNEEPAPEQVAEVTISVRADLQYIFEFLPTFGSTVFGESEEILLVILDREGNQVQEDISELFFTWTESGNHGTIGLPDGERTRTNPATYQAKPTEQQEFPAPRIDQISAVVEQRYRVFTGTAFNPNQFEFFYRELGSATGFVTVRVPNPMPATFVNHFVQSGTGGCVTAYYQVRKIPGATGYSIMATNFGDAGDPFGGTFELSWTGASNDVLDHGEFWRVRLEAGCSQNQFAIDFRRSLYSNRYSNATVEVTVSEPDG